MKIKWTTTAYIYYELIRFWDNRQNPKKLKLN